MESTPDIAGSDQKQFKYLSESTQEEPPRKKVIFILGPTGVGKSNLALEVASRFNTEIVSADSIQIYQGLDIGSAKVTDSEKAKVKHHLLDILPPHCQTFTVHDFLKHALPTIASVGLCHSSVVVVGGSHQYIEALLFQEYLSATASSTSASSSPCSIDQSTVLSSSTTTQSSSTEAPNLKVTNESDYERLKRVDPIMANKLHPNDERKIKRALAIFDETGIPQSEHLLSRRNSLRYDSLCFWLDCDLEVLDERLDARVDEMLDRGLVEELWELKKTLSAQKDFVFDYTRGILQSIGFKEFEEYFEYLCKKNISQPPSFLHFRKSKQTLPSSTPTTTTTTTTATKNSSEGERGVFKVDQEERRLYHESVLKLKTQTRKYARKQLRWIGNRLANRINLIKLSSTDLSKWESGCVEPAIKMVDEFLKAPEFAFSALPKKTSQEVTEESSADPLQQPILCPNDKLNTWKKYFCERCSREVNGLSEWRAHLKSRNHRKRKRDQ